MNKLNIKAKLYLGLGILTALIILLWSSGTLFIRTLSQDAEAILRDNNRSVSYASRMNAALDSMLQVQVTRLEQHGPNRVARLAQENRYQLIKARFDSVLNLQKQNITEQGEQELVYKIDQAYKVYLNRSKNLSAGGKQPGLTPLISAFHQLSSLIFDLERMNLNAINKKYQQAERTADRVFWYMTVSGLLCTILALWLLHRYPDYVADPIRELIRSIQQIAMGDYEKRLHFETGDEFEELSQSFNRMASRLKAFEATNMAKVLDEKLRIEAIINHMKEGVLGFDNEGKILYVNTAALQLLNQPKNTTAGKSLRHLSASSELASSLEQALNSKEQPDVIKLEQGESTSYYLIEYIAVKSAKESPSRSPAGYVVVIKDVTRFEEINRAKDDFISVVSHELKTPIGSIGMSLRLLEDHRIGELNDEQQKLVKAVREDLNRMRATTKELLDTAKIEEGHLAMNIHPCNPVTIVEYAYETMTLQAEQKKITFHYDLESNLPPVLADMQKTVWVLVNLVANAIRYTPEGGTIRIEALKKEKFVHFSVADSGPGIDPAYLERIFDKYFRVPGQEKTSSGSGLGLSIAREFVTAQNGRIWATSERALGSTFHFTLPVFD